MQITQEKKTRSQIKYARQQNQKDKFDSVLAEMSQHDGRRAQENCQKRVFPTGWLLCLWRIMVLILQNKSSGMQSRWDMVGPLIGYQRHAFAAWSSTWVTLYLAKEEASLHFATMKLETSLLTCWMKSATMSRSSRCLPSWMENRFAK